jgi:hypothetical protein
MLPVAFMQSHLWPAAPSGMSPLRPWGENFILPGPELMCRLTDIARSWQAAQNRS